MVTFCWFGFICKTVHTSTLFNIFLEHWIGLPTSDFVTLEHPTVATGDLLTVPDGSSCMEFGVQHWLRTMQLHTSTEWEVAKCRQKWTRRGCKHYIFFQAFFVDGSCGECSVLLFVCSVLSLSDQVYGQQVLCEFSCKFYKL